MLNEGTERSTDAGALRHARNGTSGSARGHERYLAFVAPAAVGVFLFLYRRVFLDPSWIPVHDTLTQFTEFLYAYASYQNGELPLWNSYLYGGQPFYLLLNHGLLLNPIVWTWFAAGSLLQLSPKQIFVACHLTEVVFFSAGGCLLATQLTRRLFAGLAAFLILLFCGEALYWTTQVYSLGIIEYVPWILFLFLRYVRQQTAGRAILFALMLAAAMNVYYPAYLSAFIITLIVLLALLYPSLFRRVNYRRLGAHAALVLPLLALLLLPTYLIYQEITTDYYQIGRYAGPDQTDLHEPRSAFDATHFAEMGMEQFTEIFITPPTDYADGTSLVGVLALSFALYELFTLSRRGVFWGLAALCMALNAMGRATPVYDLMSYVSPFYTVIRANIFFRSFLTLSLAILAAMGAHRFLVHVRRSRTSAGGARWRSHPAVPVMILLALSLIVPAGQGAMPALAAAVLAALVLAGRSGMRRGGGWTLAASSMTLILILAVGAVYLGRITERAYHNWQSTMFSYASVFNFSPERPDWFLRVQPLGPEYSGECCVDYYHLAERIDAPYGFDRWRSLHTQFVSRAYYDRAAVAGFDRLMRKKFHWFDQYAVATDIRDYHYLLDQAMLVLEDDEAVLLRGRGQPGALPDASKGEANGDENAVLLLSKSANRLALETRTDHPRFLLYTDSYHAGFTAKIDGKAVPVLKAMGVLKAVEVPEGRHVVEFIFRPVYRLVLAGYLAVSLPALLWVVGWCVIWLANPRRHL